MAREILCVDPSRKSMRRKCANGYLSDDRGTRSVISVCSKYLQVNRWQDIQAAEAREQLANLWWGGRSMKTVVMKGGGR